VVSSHSLQQDKKRRRKGKLAKDDFHKSFKVSVNDQIRFVHVKTDRFIYQTSTLIDDTYEVTLDSRGTAWTLLLDGGATATKQDTLKANDCIRIFHKEGGYLRATKDNQGNYFPAIFLTLVFFRCLQSWYDVSSSYYNIWQIEEENPSDTGTPPKYPRLI
jgi:hypothetical protein